MTTKSNSKKLLLHVYMSITVLGWALFVPFPNLGFFIGSNSVTWASVAIIAENHLIALCAAIWLFSYPVLLLFAYVFSLIKKKYKSFAIASIINALGVIVLLIYKLLFVEDSTGLLLLIISSVVSGCSTIVVWKILIENKSSC